MTPQPGLQSNLTPRYRKAVVHMANPPISLKQTSKKVASDAARILRDPKATKTEREVAASALVQSRLHN